MADSIVLKDLTKIYKTATKNFIAVSDLDLTIKQDEFFCLVGPSGCGKSTLLKLIAGLEVPTRGEVSKSGTVSMVFQSGALLPWLNVRENVEFGMKMYGVPKHEQSQQVIKYLELVNLEDLENKYPRELSGGQRQRVGLARALAMEPEILLLDEPFSALDPLTTEELHRYLLKIWEQTHKTIIMVSHMLQEAILLADRIGVMKTGKIIDIVDVSLPRPRSENQQSYYPIIQSIRKKFTD